jgi:hypothetical protein
VRRLESGGDDSSGLCGRVVGLGRKEHEVEDLGSRGAHVEVAVCSTVSYEEYGIDILVTSTYPILQRM